MIELKYKNNDDLNNIEALKEAAFELCRTDNSTIAIGAMNAYANLIRAQAALTCKS